MTNVFNHWYGWLCVPPFIPILGYNLTCRIDLLSHPNHNGKSSVLRRILLNSLMLLFLRASIFSDNFILNTISLLGVPHNKFCTLISFISIPANSRVDMWRGVVRSGIPVSVPFVERCLNSPDHGFVSTCRSSNRTYRFPVSGFLQRYQTFAFERMSPDLVLSIRTRPRVSYKYESE